MRRFLIWSGLILVVAVILLVVGLWAYSHFYARFQPVTITRDQAEIQQLLDQASWVSPGGGSQTLYVVGYRDSASTQRYDREEAEKLRIAGVDVRSIVFARPDKEGLAQSTPAERATVAELWLSRDYSLYQRWLATPSRSWTAAGLPASDGNLARTGVVEVSRQFVSRLNELLSDTRVKTGYPLVIWRDRDGFLKACACADSRSWAFVRDDFGAPDATALPTPSAPQPPMTPEQPTQTQGLPYPNLPTAPPAGAPGTSGSGPMPAPLPPQAGQTGPGAAPATPRPAPQLQTPKPDEEDTQFY